MDSKLKALKVADLKAILATADVHTPAKATKADLITRILASEPAQDAYRAIYEPAEEPAPVEEELPAEADPPPPLAPVEALDPEEEKRRQRAERFGIPLVQPKEPKAPKAKEVEKLNARAARFGLKRSAPAEVDSEEAERRRKRAERFGL